MADAQPAVQLPRYRCHKEVSAAKITRMDVYSNENRVHLEFGEIRSYVDEDITWFERHKPGLGGYYVVYEDGYTSYSPAAAFEPGYTRI